MSNIYTVPYAWGLHEWSNCGGRVENRRRVKRATARRRRLLHKAGRYPNSNNIETTSTLLNKALSLSTPPHGGIIYNSKGYGTYILYKAILIIGRILSTPIAHHHEPHQKLIILCWNHHTPCYSQRCGVYPDLLTGPLSLYLSTYIVQCLKLKTIQHFDLERDIISLCCDDCW